jgi:DNA-binding CsgD family transcriptional regulator
LKTLDDRGMSGAMDAHEVVGRDHELATTADFVDALATGPAALWIEGDAGIGKTTLYQAALALASRHELRLLASRPAAAESGLTFAVLGDLLATVDHALYGDLPEPQRRALAAALLLEAQAGGDAVDQRAVGVALLAVLRALQPLVVAVDDAQWADPSSASVLTFAWRRLQDERVGFLLAVRAGVASPFDPEGARPRMPFRRIEVGPLSVGAMHRVVGSRLGLSLPRPMLLRVHEASRGNPFYALELARFLGAVGETVPGTPLPLTERLADVAALRLAALPQPDDDVLLAVALLGECSVDVIDRALGDGAAAAARVDEAVAASVLERDGRYVRFAHPLLAEAVHARSSSENRRRVHQLLAGAVSDAEQQARHLALAAVGPDREAALALDAAADGALARGAPASAAELAELALALTSPDDAEAVADRTIAAAERHVAAGGLRRAESLLAGLLPDLPRGRRRAAVLVRLGRLSSNVEVLAARCAEALEDAQGDDSQLAIIHILLGAASSVRGGGGMAHALAHGELAVSHARLSGDPSLAAATLAQVAVWETRAGRLAEQRLDEAVAVDVRDHRREILGNPDVARGLLRLYQGRLDESRALLEKALATATAYGHDINCGDLHGRLAELECRSGRWSEADRHATASYELAEQISFEHFGAWVCYRRGLVDAHLGRVAEARAAAERGIELSPPGEAVHLNQGVLAFLELGLGDAEAAATRMRPVLRWLAEVGRAVTPFPIALYGVEALVEVGDEGAAALVAQLEREGEMLESPFAVATAQRSRALLDASEGRVESAIERLEAALDTQKRYDWPFERARTLLVLGDVRRRAKEKRSARATLEEAATALEDLGAPIWAAKARASLARISGRTTRDRGELTPTERRVAELVADGRTNKEVAAALFVALRTVEWNLSKVYTKLDVRSRTELARKLAAERSPHGTA